MPAPIKHYPIVAIQTRASTREIVILRDACTPIVNRYRVTTRKFIALVRLFRHACTTGRLSRMPAFFPTYLTGSPLGCCGCCLAQECAQPLACKCHLLVNPLQALLLAGTNCPECRAPLGRDPHRYIAAPLIHGFPADNPGWDQADLDRERGRGLYP